MSGTFILEGTLIDGIKEYGILKEGSSCDDLFRYHHLIRLKKIKVPRNLLAKELPCCDVLTFITSLKQLLENGVSIHDTVNLLIHDSSKQIFRYIYIATRNELKAGAALSEAIASLSPLFSDFFISVVQAAEKGGQLLPGLLELENFYAEQVQRENQFRKIIRYPKIVFGFSLLFGFGILVYVIPMFKNIYRLQGDNLPLLTKGLVALSDLFHLYSYVLAAFVISSIVLYKVLDGRRYISLLLKLLMSKTVLGTTNQQWLFSYAIGMLLKNGTDLLEALDVLEISRGIGTDLNIRKIKKMLKQGERLSDVLKETKGFSDIFYYSVLSAEGVGKLHLGFEQVSAYLKRQSEDRFQMISRLVEPFIMVLLGIMIFMLLLGVYLPIFDMGNYVG